MGRDLPEHVGDAFHHHGRPRGAAGDLGFVHCTENILSETRGSLAITAILATNVFERRAGRWLLVHHHASHILAPQDPDPEPEAA